METNSKVKMTGSWLTHEKKRQCLFCNKPIADQKHATQKFCEREVLPDNSIKSCKDDYHIQRTKHREAFYLQFLAYHKDINKRISNLLEQKGNRVTVADLDQFGIQLNRTIEMAIPETQLGVYTFIGYTITQTTFSNFIIKNHENSL